MSRRPYRCLKYRAVGRRSGDDGSIDERSMLLLVPANRRWPRMVWAAAAGDSWAKRVWAAVLMDAIAALRGQHLDGLAPRDRKFGRPDRLRREARRWVRAMEEQPLGTFESVCVALDIDAKVVRKDLLAVGKR